MVLSALFVPKVATANVSQGAKGGAVLPWGLTRATVLSFELIFK